MQENCSKKNISKIGIILSMVMLFLIMPFNFNNVNASENLGSYDFINQTAYTYNLGTIIDEYDCISIGDFYLSIDDNPNVDDKFAKIYLSYPSFTSGTNQITYKTISIDKSSNSNSTTNKYFYENPIGYSSYGNNLGATTTLYPYDSILDTIEININASYSPSLFYSHADNIYAYRYRKGMYICNRVAIRNSSNIEIATIYFVTGSTDILNGGTMSRTSPMLKYNRSEYIKYEIYTEYIDPLNDPINSIVGGVSNFLNIEIFPNFRLSSILLIILGIAFFSFLLHLLVK